jgi:adenylate cyclase
MAQAVTSFSLGELAATREHAEKAVALYDPGRHAGHTHVYGQDPRAASLAFAAVALWLLGYPNQAAECSRLAVARGAELGHPTTHALALYFSTMFRQYCRDAPAVQKSAEATSAIALEHGLSLWRANGQIMGGWALVEQGAWNTGVAQIRQGLMEWVETGAETHRTYFLGLLAEALAKGGQFEEALGVVAQALAMMQGTGTVFYAAELHRLQGEFLLQQEATPAARREAEACFRRAMNVAQQQQAKSLELRAAMSLSRLFHKQDRAREARTMLAETFGWFTEGFDTRDLQEAKALLEAMA